MEIGAHIERAVGALGEGASGHRYLLAVSGGLDSMVLWDAWHRVGPGQYGVAHYHHGTREAADRDLALVEARAKALGVPFHSAKREPSVACSEASLRQDRYAFLHQVQATDGYRWLITAHHLQDQWETLQMRLLRGTGLEGLGCMAPQTGSLVRPLLGASRQSLEAYANRHQVQFEEDETNGDRRYLRNRVRQDLTRPWNRLAEPFGGEASLERIHGLLEEVRDANAWLGEEDDRVLGRLGVSTPLWWRFRVSGFDELSEFWQRRTLRAMGRDLGTREVGRLDWERLRRAVTRSESLDVTQDLRFRASCGWGFLLRRDVAPRWIEEAPGTFACAALGLRVEARRNQGRVRFLRPGDRFEGKKVVDRLKALQVPVMERQWIPVLAEPSSSEVRWHLPLPSDDLRMSQLKFAFSFLDNAPTQ